MKINKIQALLFQLILVLLLVSLFSCSKFKDCPNQNISDYIAKYYETENTSFLDSTLSSINQVLTENKSWNEAKQFSFILLKSKVFFLKNESNLALDNLKKFDSQGSGTLKYEYYLHVGLFYEINGDTNSANKNYILAQKFCKNEYCDEINYLIKNDLEKYLQELNKSEFGEYISVDFKDKLVEFSGNKNKFRNFFIKEYLITQFYIPC